MKTFCRQAVLGFLGFLFCAASLEAGAVEVNPDLMKLSLQELADVVVTSVAKKGQNPFAAPAAVYVITQEDIRRSGVTSIPEVLRMVPGMEVARLNSNKWAITARGFNEQFARRLLVLIDGRSVYTPLFSGVYWDVQDTVLEDIERIEVVRGPGGTLWGANAMNGVINIITKKTRDTQGGLAAAGAGIVENGSGVVRYGGRLDEKSHYRVYAKYFSRNAFEDSKDNSVNDDWVVGRGGFRMDWELSEKDALTVQGDYYDGESGEQGTGLRALTQPFLETITRPEQIDGLNIMTRWDRKLADRSNFKLQFYYDRARRKGKLLDQTIDTVDLEFQHQFTLGDRHELVWGINSRLISDELKNRNLVISFTPDNQVNHLNNAFFQDDIALVRNKLHLFVGSKFGWNSFTGFELQPSARIAWTPTRSQTIWAAVSRAVRIPSRFEDAVRLNTTAFASGGTTALVSILGSKNFKSEDLLAYEAGYRMKVTKRLLIDIAAFAHLYDDLKTTESDRTFFESDPAPAHLTIASINKNLMSGEVYGFEAAAQWTVTKDWELNASFTWLDLQLNPDPGGSSDDEEAGGDSPDYRLHVRSHWNLPSKFEFDAAIYFVDDLRGQITESYTRLDARLGWRPMETLALSLGVQNLQDSNHKEFDDPALGFDTAEIPRNVYGKLTLKF